MNIQETFLFIGRQWAASLAELKPTNLKLTVLISLNALKSGGISVLLWGFVIAAALYIDLVFAHHNVWIFISLLSMMRIMYILHPAVLKKRRLPFLIEFLLVASLTAVFRGIEQYGTSVSSGSWLSFFLLHYVIILVAKFFLVILCVFLVFSFLDQMLNHEEDSIGKRLLRYAYISVRSCFIALKIAFMRLPLLLCIVFFIILLDVVIARIFIMLCALILAPITWIVQTTQISELYFLILLALNTFCYTVVLALCIAYASTLYIKVAHEQYKYLFRPREPLG